MIEIDGAEKSGSGTVVRFAVALCTLTGEPVHLVRIRAKREKPGLRPQHLQAVRACASLSSGRLEGDEVGSREIVYYPGETAFEGGARQWDIGTAGSATMMAFALVPIALFARTRSQFTIKGGLFQDFAPTAFHMQRVLFPLIEKMGARARLDVVRPGYVPRGGGELAVAVEPVKAPLKGLDLTRRGEVTKIGGVSLASHLERERVARRMADRSAALLGERGYRAEMEVIEDASALQKGAALFLRAETRTGCILGSDRAGKRGRGSESIAGHAVEALFEDLAAGATVDRYAADQLILFAGLAAGRSRYLVPAITDHVRSNAWLIEKMLGARVDTAGNMISIDGVGFFRE
ncbi:MAG: RNA 3'-terminal phosphate cyclase [Syntrophobacteraceae bacterium]